MTVEEALPWLKEHWNELLESIGNYKYKPSSVSKAEIPKDNGGIRMLGIPTVIDQIQIIRTFSDRRRVRIISLYTVSFQCEKLFELRR